ncbi:ATP-binding protein [Rubrivirga sp.]|uniref:ATP-binding protein n=1 Tax=Rubrivirga sp. TaxID=1885344 RepID=UPI003B521ABF
MSAAAQSLRVRGDTAELARVRASVGAWAASAGLGEARARRLQLAVDETVANAIEHGLDDGAQVVVRATPGRGRLTVTVRYRGDRFDPTTAPTAPADEVVRQRAAHGYGLHLIRRLVDDLAYRWDRGTNEVQMTMRREV